MNVLPTRRAATALMFGLIALALSSCAVTDGDYGYNTNPQVGFDYYDPWMGDYGAYGGWGPGYRVGPPRQHMPQREGDRGRPQRPGAYRPAPGAHPVPSIPSRPHPAGSRPAAGGARSRK